MQERCERIHEQMREQPCRRTGVSVRNLRRQAGQIENWKRMQKKMTAFCCLSCLCLLFWPLPRQAGTAVLDVGQGDGIYIRTSGGADIFIDGGSSDVKSVGTYRILPFLKSQGAAGIDCWFVSHLDQDHISGLKEIIDSGYAVGQVVFAEGVLRDEAYEQLTGLLLEKQIQVRHLAQGDTLRAQNACFTCLAPNDREHAADRNAGSLVLLYEDDGFTGFFPGDISKEEERKLLNDGKLGRVDLYKAAHHGSNYSNSEEILKRTSPAVSVISCAEENDYGHPGKEAAANMAENSSLVYETMQSGQVWIRWDAGKLQITEYVHEAGDPPAGRQN